MAGVLFDGYKKFNGLLPKRAKITVAMISELFSENEKFGSNLIAQTTQTALRLRKV